MALPLPRRQQMLKKRLHRTMQLQLCMFRMQDLQPQPAAARQSSPACLSSARLPAWSLSMHRQGWAPGLLASKLYL